MYHNNYCCINTFELEDAKRVYNRIVFGSTIDNSWPIIIGNSSDIEHLALGLVTKALEQLQKNWL